MLTMFASHGTQALRLAAAGGLIYAYITMHEVVRQVLTAVHHFLSSTRPPQLETHCFPVVSLYPLNVYSL